MKNVGRLSSRLRPVAVCLGLAAFVAMSAGCHREIIRNHDHDNDLGDFEQVNLVADRILYQPEVVDTTLQNAWGLAWAPSGIAWVNSQAGHVSKLFTGDGGFVRPDVKIPTHGDTVGGLPTGIVFNSTKGFILSNNQAANFLFVGVDGILSGWNGAANTRALVVQDHSSTSAFTGLALAANRNQNLLYAADFRGGKVDVWDTTFKSVALRFHDPAIPAGYSPFNVQPVGSWLFVTYAKVGPDGREAVGQGMGFVDIFNPDGTLVKRFASGGPLNAPWGVVQAPAGFLKQKDLENDDSGGGNGGGNNGGNGGTSGGPGNGNNGGGNGGGGNNGGGNSGSTPGGPGNGNNGNGDGNNNSGPGNGNNFDPTQPVMLIGNFGDGRINVYSMSGQFLGHLQSNDKTIVISGLWALGFAPATSTISQSRLYFTAGPAMEVDGLFGYLLKQQ